MASKEPMKLLVQIPCLNEQENIAMVIKSIPRSIENWKVTTLLIDDCSTDDTVEIATKAGIDIVIKKKSQQGLADSFRIGQAYFLNGEFDCLVNTDGDNQYYQEHIPMLISRIESGIADIVIADRGPASLKHFHPVKRLTQKIGSKILSFTSRTKVTDAASGFRAYSRKALAHIFITTNFSYAMESLIQAGNKNLRVASIQSGAKPVDRPSRLFKNSWQHVRSSGKAILKSFLMYRPLFYFSLFGLLLLLLGSYPLIRYLIFFINGTAGQHFQSLLLGSILLTASFLAFAVGLVAELSRINRQLTEDQIAGNRLTQKIDEELLLAQFDAKVIYRA